MPIRYEQGLGDEPVQPEYFERMKQMGRAIDQFWNPDGKKKVGFVLMVFPFGEGGRMNYLSNATRADVVRALREQLKYFEAEDAKRS